MFVVKYEAHHFAIIVNVSNCQQTIEQQRLIKAFIGLN